RKLVLSMNESPLPSPCPFTCRLEDGHSLLFVHLCECRSHLRPRRLGRHANRKPRSALCSRFLRPHLRQLLDDLRQVAVAREPVSRNTLVRFAEVVLEIEAAAGTRTPRLRIDDDLRADDARLHP